MIQIKKTILTLVALLAMTTGAWADGTVTVTEIKASEMPTSWDNNNNPVKATDLPGFTAVTRDDAKALGAPAAEGEIYVFYAISNNVFMGLHWNNGVLDDSDGGFSLGGIYALQDVFKFYYVAAPPSGPDVAWDKATKTGQFTMPGGNVTLEPEYYPQATLAFQGLTAAEDAAAKTEAPLAVVADGAVTGGTLMYYVATDKNFSQADAIALAETQWSADIPTAETIEAAGTYIMWYYIKGDAEHSDTDPIPLVVTLLPAPTYAVTFADGTDEPTKWTAEPNAGVTKGQTVTVTYTGSKKVIGVKAEKKAAAPASTPLDNTTTAWSAGTFTVPAGGLTYSDAITVSGDVTLTLTDGETLTLNKGISLASGATLTVEGNGTMVVNGTNGNTSSTVGGNHGTLVLTSGTLTARGGNGGSVGDDEYDHHGGNGGDAINGSVIVSGGTLTARGGNGGSVGIDCFECSGGNGGDAISGTLTINGGSTSVNNGSNGSIGDLSDECTAGKGGKAVAGTVTDNR